MHSKIKRGVEKELKNIYVTRVFSFLSPICPCMISLIVLKKKKQKQKNKKQKEKNVFTWLQACFLRDVRVICCNSLGDSHFQTNVIDDVENLLEYYLHISYFMFCTLTSCTHYMQIVAKSCTWKCVCCLNQPSLIAYDIMCTCKFLFWLGV